MISRSLRWIPNVDTVLEDVLLCLNISRNEMNQCIDDGCVFIGRTRAHNIHQKVAAHTEVRVNILADDSMIQWPDPFVLYDHDGLLVVHKPAGISTIGDSVCIRDTLIEHAAKVTNRRIEQLHPTSRLDRDVSGVVVFTTNASVARALADARTQHRYQRRYVALASGSCSLAETRWAWPIARDTNPLRRKAVSPNTKDAIDAVTDVRVIAQHDSFGMLAVSPQTGRTHQIRVHAAKAGLPLLGDATYGGPRTLVSKTGVVTAIDRIALHCARVCITLVANKEYVFYATIPHDLKEIAETIGFHDSELWSQAIESDIHAK